MFPFTDISENNPVYERGSNSNPIIAIRMSTGADGLRFDRNAAANYQNASADGKLILQYHYCGNNAPTEEANLFISACQPFAEYDMYCIDAELGQSKDWKQTFANVVYAATGCNVFDYMNISITNDLGPLPNCPLWLAAPSWGFDQTITELNPSVVYTAQQGPEVNGIDSDMMFAEDLNHVKLLGHQVSAPPATITTPPVIPAAPPTPTPEPTPTPTPALPIDPTTLPPTVTPPIAPPAVPAQPIVPSTPEPAPPKVGFWQLLLNFLKRLLP